MALAALWRLSVWAHAHPYVAASWPAPDPLAAGTGGAALRRIAEARFSGGCLGVNVSSGGSAVAVTADGGRCVLVFLWPDGRQLRVTVTVPGEPAQAVFVADDTLVLWIPPGDGAKGGGTGTVAAVSLVAAGQARTAVSPLWQLKTSASVCALVSLHTAVGIVSGGVEGLPHTCQVVAAANGKPLWQVTVADGVFTAWDGAAPSGTLALAGAEYDGTGMRAFVRLYAASGKVLCSLETPEGPAYLVKPSATGRYLLAATGQHLHLADSEGRLLWSARFPPLRIEGCLVDADGRTIVSTARNTLALDRHGAVRARWRNAGLSSVAAASGGDAFAVALSDGIVLLDGTGRVKGATTASGGGGLLGVAADATSLCRAADGVMTLYGFATGP